MINNLLITLLTLAVAAVSFGQTTKPADAGHGATATAPVTQPTTAPTSEGAGHADNRSGASASTDSSAKENDKMPDVIERVWKAAGGDKWGKVKRIKFTFVVEHKGDVTVSATHDWDVVAGKDTVTTNGKTATCDVDPMVADHAVGPEEMTARKRWVNDAYWLLMPLKLKDVGVKFQPVMMTMDMPPSRANVTMSFDKGVGTTSGDEYDLSIDLKKDQIDHWVYRPNEKTKAGYTWEGYKDFNGLVLSTEHKSSDGRRRIYCKDVSVEMK